MNDITKRSNTSVGQPTAANPFSAYGEAATHRNIVGELLKFSKGDWMSGQDNDDVAVGTQFIANMDEMLVGWIRWEDNKPTDHIMGKVSEGYQILRRNELGDTDQNEWEVDDSGKPRDPWQLSNYLLDERRLGRRAVHLHHGIKGGRDALGDLCKEYGKVLVAHADEYPVVAIGVRSYEHPNKSYGRIKTPEFKIVGWQPKTAFASDLGESGEELDATFDSVSPPPAAKPNGKKAGRI